MSRIFLSAPDVRGPEKAFLDAAVESNWIAPIGPDLTAFENELAEIAQREFAVGLTSATAALQLALLVEGIGEGDEVITSSFTFVATANAIHHTGAMPIFVDSDMATWNLDAGLLDDFLLERSRKGRIPKALIPVDLYGQPCNYSDIEKVCERYGVVLIEDAAEALGAHHADRACGSFGKAAAFSFNGNKMISTSGGGMLVTDDEQMAQRVRHLATQARDSAPHYQHTERGFNFRMSNLLAAFGRGQLVDLDDRVERRREINRHYRSAFSDLPGVSFMPEGPDSYCTFWLSCVVIDEETAGVGREQIRLALEAADVESRPLWKPMHRQPAYAQSESVISGVSDDLFRDGLCLPSGSGLTDLELDKVVEIVRSTFPN
jgi:dTDP-4-amino-4,6-dideoxygalactose transaminase